MLQVHALSCISATQNIRRLLSIALQQFQRLAKTNIFYLNSKKRPSQVSFVLYISIEVYKIYVKIIINPQITSTMAYTQLKIIGSSLSLSENDTYL